MFLRNSGTVASRHAGGVDCLVPLTQVDAFESLSELALDLRWSWDHSTDKIWRELDPELWATTHNPWVVLQTIARDRIERAFGDPAFRREVERLLQSRRQALASPAWFQQDHAHARLGPVAYFSMEFMLSDALPIYSGGLGNVAGDQLKATSDLGVPVIGVGLLFQQGYFRQVIDNDGAQQALFPYNDPGQLPISPLRQANGEWLRLEIALPGYSVWLRAWQVQVGRVKLYLLDSNDAANVPARRAITSELYGGGPELRLQQELLLGIGGWRLMDALGIEPDVCHLNEGHAAFALLERARSYMRETGQTFDVALAVTRAGNLFTTHTAVPAGFDRFAPALIERYLGGYARQELGIASEQLLALGREDPSDPSERFNMAYLAIRGSGAVNGVSRLHGEVSRRIFTPLFPRWPEREVPVAHVTNGVHVPTWDSAAADELWTAACGKGRWLGTASELHRNIHRVSDERLWQLRTDASNTLVEYVRQRLSRQLRASGASSELIEGAKRVFSPRVLTLGFARRFATYKRPNLLLHDRARLLRLLRAVDRPVQLVIAGKAHPNDGPGQALIREWINFILEPGIQPHLVFLSDYDMLMAEQLVQGVDVWINTPLRPWEASGTSGMKVLVNGGLNVSVLDGWWAEAYTPEVGWALNGEQWHGRASFDAAEAEALYELLEREVVPEFYNRDASGIPRAWVARMRQSMAQLTPRFSTNRSVREYTEQHYIPAAAAYHGRKADGGAQGKQIVAWQARLHRQWPSLRFVEVNVVSGPEHHAFEVQVELGELDPDAVRVELYADGDRHHPASRQLMSRDPAGAAHWHVYRARAPATRPASDYTARILPHMEEVAIPLEDTRILWQK